jgi:hypothetical protein
MRSAILMNFIAEKSHIERDFIKENCVWAKGFFLVEKIPHESGFVLELQLLRLQTSFISLYPPYC